MRRAVCAAWLCLLTGTAAATDYRANAQDYLDYVRRLQPGDRLTTTCSYNAPTTFGRGTNEEMCYWFALAYPAGALTDNGFIGTLTHGANACLGR